MITTLNTTMSIGESVNVSPSLWSVAAGLNKIHSIWKLYIKGITYFNPDNFFGLSTGLIYETLIADRLFLKLPTVPFFVMAKFLDLFEQEDQCRRDSLSWIDSLQCTQPLYDKMTDDYAQYKISRFQYTSQFILFRIQKIAYTTLQLGLQSFKLIMRIMDIVELITIDPARLNEFMTQSVRECGLHIPRCLNFLVKNKRIFIKRLEAKEEGIGSALKFLGCKKIKAQDIIGSAKSLLNNCETGLDYYEKISTTVGDVVKELGKKFIYDWSPEPFKAVLRDHNLDPRSQRPDTPPKPIKKAQGRPKKPLLYYKRRGVLKNQKNKISLNEPLISDVYNSLSSPKQTPNGQITRSPLARANKRILKIN